MQTALASCEQSLKSTAAAALLGVGPDANEIRQTREALEMRRQRIASDLEAIATQRPVESSIDNMDYANSLQVLYAERYLLSSANDFAFVREILAERPSARRGRRMHIA